VSNAERLVGVAEQLANEIVGFFEIAGPGKGDARTKAFMKELASFCRKTRQKSNGCDLGRVLATRLYQC
jgi:hypothetical protein